MEKTLDLKVIFYLIRRKIVWVVLAAIIGGLVAYVYTDNMVPKKYTSTALVYISNTQDLGEINQGNINASRSFAETYRIILQSDKANSLLKNMLTTDEKYRAEYEKCDYKTSYSVRVTIKDEAEVLQFSVTSRDPDLSAIVCNAMYDVSKELISDIFDDAGKAYSLGDAYANYAHTSPDVKMSAALGALFLVSVVCVFVVLWALLDNRVKDEADFAAKISIPVLGEVPSIRGEDDDVREGYYYYAYTKKEKEEDD